MPGPTGLRRARAEGYRRGGVQHHRGPGVNEAVRLLPRTCGRAGLDAWRLPLLICGAFGAIPASDTWSPVKLWGLTRAKRVAAQRKVHEDMLLLCPLQGRAWRRGSAPRLAQADASTRGGRERPTVAGRRFWLEKEWA
ncbi:hypothetical protein ERJ75_001292700 [Trypanosoma vivax]|nr:hypothetical protein ERJ75_001292700 [Trypanosoma vivax]